MIKLLVIDDSETNTMLIKSVFEDLNDSIKVYIENNSREAVDRVKEIMPDLILLDLMMPGINGEDVLKELKRTPQTKDIPIVVVSAKQEQEDINYVINMGAIGFIKKPINVDNLHAKIIRIINEC